MSDLSSECLRKRTSVDSHKSMDFVLLCSIRVEGTIAKSQRVRAPDRWSWFVRAKFELNTKSHLD